MNRLELARRIHSMADRETYLLMTGSSPGRNLLPMLALALPPNHAQVEESPTISRIDLGGCASCFSEHDGNARVVLLHDRVGAGEERPRDTARQFIEPKKVFFAGPKTAHDSTAAAVVTMPRGKKSTSGDGRSPGGCAGLAGLAEKEPDLLEGLGESVAARHLGGNGAYRCSGWLVRSIGRLASGSKCSRWELVEQEVTTLKMELVHKALRVAC